jgi:hypothetical protein
MNADQVVKVLERECERAGSVSAWADANNLSRQNVQATVKGKIPPGGAIIAALGFRRVLMEKFVEISEEVVPPRGWSEVVIDRRTRRRVDRVDERYSEEYKRTYKEKT